MGQLLLHSFNFGQTVMGTTIYVLAKHLPCNKLSLFPALFSAGTPHRIVHVKIHLEIRLILHVRPLNLICFHLFPTHVAWTLIHLAYAFYSTLTIKLYL
jgi:hypothetical protein